jgi:uncharacterized membrane protein
MSSESSNRRLIIILLVIIVLNGLATAYLLKTVADQDHRIQTLERNDKVTQSVNKLNSKFDTLIDKVQGLFH